MTRLATTFGVIAAWMLMAQPAAAHTLVGRLDSPLPLVVYLTGAAMAVALSFAFVLLRDVRAPALASPRTVAVPRLLTGALRVLGLVAWLWIVAQALAGGSSDASVATLFLWVYGWVGVAIASAFIGPIWTWLDPFTTLFDISAWVLRRFGAHSPSIAPYPARLGVWPAAVGLLAVVWLELAYRGNGLAVVLVVYTAWTLLAMANFGRDRWRASGEIFSVWFGLLNRLAPFGIVERYGQQQVVRRPFASGLIGAEWGAGHLALVAIGTGSILFDGLSQTKVWFDTFGLPALPIATLELVGFLLVVIAVALAVGRFTGYAAVGAGLVPITVGYLVAHYLTYLLGDGQRIVVALSDPLQLGWDLFGTAFYEPGTGWIPPVALWTVMLVSVVGGHVLGAWAGHVAGVREGKTDQRLRLRQVPLAALMVVLTATTLWSLGQAVIKDPVEAKNGATVVEAIDG